MKNLIYCIACIVFVLLSSFKSDTSVDELRINQLQVIASHNSYRLKTEPIYNYWNSSRHPLSKHFFSKALDYSHTSSFEEQLSKYAMRGLEIDIYNDPQGGLFYNRQGNKLIGKNVESGISALKNPGFKVLHIPDFDYTTHYYTFVDALKAVKNWSDNNPTHLPLYIMIETKELHIMKFFKKNYCTKILKFTNGAVDSIDLEIDHVFGKNSEKIITPDKVRGKYNTLNEAILNNSWPLVTEARGKVMFILYTSNETKQEYLQGHYSLKGRNMFVYSSPGNPETAFIIKDNPKKEFKEIQRLVKLGYMIRTRADADTKEARNDDYSKYNKALESGGQIIATDYYKSDERCNSSKKWSTYQMQFPNKHVARINMINGSPTIEYID